MQMSEITQEVNTSINRQEIVDSNGFDTKGSQKLHHFNGQDVPTSI